MITFKTHIKGIPCQCRITHYYPGQAMIITGLGFGDADPPEQEEFEYEILDRKGYVAPWLTKLMTSKDQMRIEQECSKEINEYFMETIYASRIQDCENQSY